MKITIKTLIVLLLTLMSVSAAQAFDCSNYDIFFETGVVCKIQLKSDLEPSKIWIDEFGVCDEEQSDNWLEIIGVPFGNLNLQLNDLWPDALEEIMIDEGDCVTVEYIQKPNLSTEDPDDYYNKWCSLLVFHDELGAASCDTCSNPAQYCYEADESGNNPPITRKPHRAGTNQGKPPWNQTGPDDPQP